MSCKGAQPSGTKEGQTKNTQNDKLINGSGRVSKQQRTRKARSTMQGTRLEVKHSAARAFGLRRLWLTL